ncbi:hypothetical protein BB560_004590, partial [Smittium megazygosporum]
KMFSSLKPFASASKNLSQIIKRSKGDLLVRQATRQPLISQGPVGRQAWNGQTVTVFGATGFLGRYVVSQLAAQGTRVVVAYRGHPENNRHLKPTGDLGMVIPMEFDIRIPNQIEECMAHSDMVINLIGRNYETKNFTLHDVFVKAPCRIAEIAQNTGVARFVHVSHLGAHASSTSDALRAKALGEDILRNNFPNTTIVRPATMYGYEDSLLNNIGYWKTFYITVDHGKSRIHPVCVEDVASAINEMRKQEWTSGKTFELYNPVQYTRSDIINLVSASIRQEINQINIPRWYLRLWGKIFDYLPYHYTSSTEVDMMGLDELPTESSENIYTFSDLGIQPQEIERLVLQYVRHYRESPYEDLGAEINPRAFRK